MMAEILSWVCFAMFLWYPIYIFRNAFWVRKIPVIQADIHAGPGISVIIPARNAAGEIGRLLESLGRQDYPASRWEVIVVDDGSSDNTIGYVSSYTHDIPSLRVISAPPCEGPAYKKNAIAEGIRQAKYEWILTTDADCQAGKGWLRSMAACMQGDTVLVSGPVQLEDGGTLFGKFQQLEFAGLIGIGAANIYAMTPNMCNGANLAYRKDAFRQVGGFAGVDRLASGDDELLMHRMFRHRLGKLVFAMHPNALIRTPAHQQWRDFANQRIRWVSKGRQYERKSVTWILSASYLSVCCLAALTIAMVFRPSLWPMVSMAWSLKALAEALVISPVLALNGKQRHLFWILAEQPFHVMYVLWAGIAGTFSRSYTWKGREVR